MFNIGQTFTKDVCNVKFAGPVANGVLDKWGFACYLCHLAKWCLGFLFSLCCLAKWSLGFLCSLCHLAKWPLVMYEGSPGRSLEDRGGFIKSIVPSSNDCEKHIQSVVLAAETEPEIVEHLHCQAFENGTYKKQKK